MLGLQRRIADYDTQLEGHITLTCTENVFEQYLKEPVFQFAQTYPRVTLDLLIGNQLINMERLEADVAVRPADQLPAQHFGFQLGTFQCFYYLRDDFQTVPNIAEICNYPNWIGFNGQMAEARIGKLLANTMKTAPVLTASNFHSVCSAAEAGLGLALLPSFIGDKYPRLQRIDSEPVFSSPVFVIAPEELKLSRRINAFMDVLKNQT
jgi:DNA-binding transcriptional LysR family regulator